MSTEFPDVSDFADDSALDPLLERLGDAFEHALDPIPARLSDAARASFAWRVADEQLAELLFDSSESELVGVRGTSSERRSFRYGAGDFVIRVHLTPLTLVVMIEPPLTVACRLTTEDGTDEHRTDDLGELVIDAPEVPLRIEVDLPAGIVVTPWITG